MAHATTREVLDVYPLTPAQQGILAETLGTPGAPIYLQHHVLEIAGTGDPIVLRDALAELIARHDVLRTAFAWDVADQPLQVVRSTAGVRLTVEDLRGAGPEAIATREAQLLGEERGAAFDLQRPPLLRVRALRTGDAAWRLITTHHHLVLDGWSVSLLHTELAEILAARAGHRAPLLRPPRPFREFVTWQRVAQDSATDETYLRELLGGVVCGTPLGDDLGHYAGLPETPGVAESGAPPVVVFRELTGEGHPPRAARRRGVLPSTIVHAAWALILADWSGTADVVFGTTVSGRPGDLADAAQRVGMFLNTSVLRIAVPWTACLGQWLREVQTCLDRSRLHEHVPAALAQRCSAAPPGTSLLSSVLAFQNYWRPGDSDVTASVNGDAAASVNGDAAASVNGDAAGGTVRVRVVCRSERTGLPVEVAVALPDEGVWVRLGHDPARVSRMQARWAAETFADLIATLTTLPGGTRLADIPASTAAPAPRHEDDAGELMSAVRARLRGRGPRPVVTAADGEANATRIGSVVELTAARLRAAVPHMVPAERSATTATAATVAICAPTGVALVTGLLASLTYGGIPVLIDPYMPAPELRERLDHERLAGAPVLVPEGTVLTADVTGPVVGIADHAHSSRSRPARCAPGAVVAHPVLTALAFGAGLVRTRLGLTGSDTVLAVLAADDPALASVVLAALAAGSRLELNEPGFAQPCSRATVLVAAAPTAVGLLGCTAPGARIVISGDPPPPDAIRRVLASGRSAWRLWASGRTGGADVCNELSHPADALLLGPVQGAMVADGAGCPVPPGRAGELVIVRTTGNCRAGIRVREDHGRGGYHDRDTPQPPFGIMIGGDGERARGGPVRVEQLGRTAADELAFIEHVLGLDRPVAAAVVTADGNGGRHAWLAAGSGGAVGVARARADMLPGRARPADYTVLAELPVARSGGVDYAALAAALLPTPRPVPPSRQDALSHRLAALPEHTREAFVSRLRSLAGRTPGLRRVAQDAQARSQQQEEWRAQATPVRARNELTLPAGQAPEKGELARALAAARLPRSAAGFAVGFAPGSAASEAAGQAEDQATGKAAGQGNAGQLVTLTSDPEWLDVASLAMVAEQARTGQAGEQARTGQAGAQALSYTDYAAWQNSAERGAARDEHAAAWRSALDGAEQVAWPTPPPAGPEAHDPTRPAGPTAADAVRVPAAAEEEVWIAAAATALAFLAGTNEVLLGVVTRPELPAETATIPGAYARTLPLRIMVSTGQPFGTTVAAVAAALRDARAHGDVPWEVVDRLLRRPLALSVAVHRQSGALAAHGDAAIAVDVAPEAVTATDGTSGQADGTVGTVLTVAHAPGRAHTKDAERLRDLTAAMLWHGTDCADPRPAPGLTDAHPLRTADPTEAQPLRAADLTDATMLAHLLRLGDGGPADTVRSATIPGAILARCHAAPGAVAVEAPDGVLSYRELVDHADGVASGLRALGLGPEDRVAVCLPRQACMAWAPLGVMIAGAAYVPLDPEYPDERLRLVLADAGARAVVTTAELADRFPPGLSVLAIDSATAPGRPPRGAAPRGAAAGSAAAGSDISGPLTALPESAAYVLYTSGSTGKPKGVVVEHRAVASFCAHIARAYRIGAWTRLLAFAAATFDVSVFELWAGLAAGATVILAGSDARMSAEALQRLLTERRVSAAELPPSLMPLLDPQRLPDLSLVSVGGEAPAGALVDTWATGEREFWNGYGPTEATVAVTLMRCRPPSAGRVPPIGLPMPGHRAYVLDESLRPVPAGVPGELCVAGCGLARGYLGRPGHTAASFVPDPYGPPGSRMYHTGDLARWTADGVLEFLGRADRQLKIRGFRVEPAEVESALAGHPGVRQVSVQPFDAHDGTRHLAAYVVPTDPQAPPRLTDLLAAVDGLLPPYMLPTRLAVLDQLPLTAVGKVDRKALPEPAVDGAGGHRDMTEWSETERVLAREVIGPLLGVASPGRGDGFFELGGNSLQAAQVTARVRDRFRAEISLLDFFREPTVAGLARLVDRAIPARRAYVPYRMTDGATLPVSYPQAMLYAACQAGGDIPGYHAPLALRLRGPLDLDALRKAFGWLTARHAPLRATFAETSGEPVQAIHPPADPTFAVSAVPDGAPGARDRSLRQAVGAEAAQPFDLARGPLLRVRVHRLGRADHVVQWTIHHIATDGWSTGVQLHEIGAAYHAFASGNEPALPPLATDYGDFVSWHRDYVAGPGFRTDLAWWRRNLAGAPPDQRLTHSAGASAPPFLHGWRNIRLPAQTATRVGEFARAHGATLYMTCLAAQAILIGAETGTDDVLMVSPYALRLRSAWEDLVGWFVNPIAVRVRLSAGWTFAELVGHARDACTAAFAHGYVPFDLLRSELGLGGHALATQFSVLNAPMRALGFRGFDVTVVGDNSGRDFTPVLEVYSPVGTRFQLSVMLRERPGGIIAGGLEYDAALIDPTTADRWHAAFLSILAAGAAKPTATLAELFLLASHPGHIAAETRR